MLTSNRFARLAALGSTLALALAVAAAPASARSSYVQDGAEMFSSATVSDLNAKISAFEAKTHKEIVVVTEPSLSGAAVDAHVEELFAKDQVNGVLFYFAKADKVDRVLGDTASRKFFPNGFGDIATSMRAQLRAGDPDGAITTGVGLVLDTYAGHESSLPGAGGTQTRPYTAPVTQHQSFGGAMSLFWLVLILIVGFMIIRAIIRAISGPRVYPPGYGGPGYGGPPMGGPGYGGGYGYGGGGGGGSFFSGLLGGLGGAFIGNELFGGGRNETIIENGGQNAGFVDGGSGGWSGGDSSGWQSDAGQADVGGMGGGSWGDSGGGFDSGGGGGDSGGGW